MQQGLWGTDPQGWADHAEPHNLPLFEAVLDAAGVTAGTSVLDVGCGTGLTLVLAARRGARVTGLDISAELLAVARERLPEVDLRRGDLETLPFGNDRFDAVVGINSFQFAGDPRAALAEASRVCRPGGWVVASLFAEPGRSQSTAVHVAMSELSPPGRQADHAPYLLSDPGNLDAVMAEAGLAPGASGEVTCVWRYADIDDALRGLLSSAGAARAAADASRAAVEEVVRHALAEFTDPGTGVVAMTNTFRWISARKPV